MRDLKLEDFQVEDNGEPQRILAASAVHSAQQKESTRPPGHALETTTLPRHFVLIFDLTFNYTSGLRLAKSAASHFIAKSISPGDDVAILTLDVVLGIHEICASTPDQAVLLERVRAIEESRQDELSPRVAGDDRLPPAAAPAASPESSENAARYRALIQRYVDSLVSCARHLDPGPGRKIVLLFSQGFDALVVERAKSRPSQSRREMMFLDVDGASSDLLEQVARGLSSADCQVFCVDPSGTRLFTREGDPGVQTQTVIQWISRETGGTVVRNTNALNGALDKIADLTATYYLLTYRPPATRPGSYHKLSVKTARTGVMLTHRQGYYESESPTTRAQ